MNDFFSCSSVVLADGIDMSAFGGIYLLIVMALFVFGVLLLEKFAKGPKGLFISSVISYVLILIIILSFPFSLWAPNAITYFCLVVISPVFYIVGFIEDLTDQLFGPVWWIITNRTIFIYVTTFIVSTLLIFALIKLILYIKHKVSSRKPQIKQEV